MILLLGGSDDSIVIKIFIRILSYFHHSVQHIITASLYSYLDLLLQFLYLSERLVKLHLQIVSFKDNGLEMHLLTSDYMFF